jgi:hypothetical protein
VGLKLRPPDGGRPPAKFDHLQNSDKLAIFDSTPSSFSFHFPSNPAQTMGLSVSKLLSGLFGKKEMRTWRYLPVIRSSLGSPTHVFHRYLDGMELSIDHLLFPVCLNSAKPTLQVGLDAAGKTTILYKLKLGEIVTTIPTIGLYRSDFNARKASSTILRLQR